MREYQRKRRKENPEVMEKARKDNRERKARIRAYVHKVKDNPCVDCGVKYPFYVMQFDHKGTDKKLFIVSRLMSMEGVKKEIKKCDLVCANCHAERTYQRSIDIKAMV